MGSLVRDIPFSEVVATIERFGQFGITPDDLRLFRGDDGVAREIAEVLAEAADGGGKHVSAQLARVIMGRNFVGVEEVGQYFNVNFTQKQLRDLKRVPFTKKELEDRRNTHVLVVSYPMSIFEVRAAAPHLFTRTESWLDAYDFVQEERPTPGWLLVRRNAVPQSTNKDWEEQLATLPKGDGVPRACELIYTLVLHALVTGRKFQLDPGVKTATTILAVQHIFIRSLDGRRLGMGSAGNKTADSSTGLASLHKPS